MNNAIFNAPTDNSGQPNANIAFQSVKQQLVTILTEEGVRNEKHFQTVLSTNDRLINVITKMQPGIVESLKKHIYQINRQKVEQVTYHQAIGRMEPFDCKCKKVRLCDDCITDEEIIIAAGSMCQFVQSVAKENEMDFMELMEQIYTILDGRGGNKNTLIFIGSSDSGKTTLMDLLLTPYEQHEIGNFKTPLKNANNTFWLENLPGADIYRCEECLLETEDVVQILKALFEGNANLESDVKYKSPIPVPKRPVVVTMNGTKAKDITKHVSGEWDAIKNRSIIITMNKALRDRIKEGSIVLMKKHGKHVARVMYEKYGHFNLQENAIITTSHCSKIVNNFL